MSVESGKRFSKKTSGPQNSPLKKKKFSQETKQASVDSGKQFSKKTSGPQISPLKKKKKFSQKTKQSSVESGKQFSKQTSSPQKSSLKKKKKFSQDTKQASVESGKQFSKQTSSPQKSSLKKKKKFSQDTKQASVESGKRFSEKQFSKKTGGSQNGTLKKKKISQETKQVEGGQEKQLTKKKRPHPSEEDDEVSPSKRRFTDESKSEENYQSAEGLSDPEEESKPKRKGFPKTGLFHRPNWKKIKAEHAELRVKRRTAASGLDSYELSVQAKKMMEPLRNRKCSKEQQKEQIPKVYDLLKGQMLTVVYSHDMARVIAAVLKWAHTLNLMDVRTRVVNELLPDVVNMSQSTYSAHLVRAMIDYCQPEQRAKMVTAFQGHVVKLLRHRFASGVLERLYNALNSGQQYELCKELYGSTHKLVPSKTITGLEVIFECWPSMKTSTLDNTKKNLLRMFDKGNMFPRMVHCVLLDYLNHASQDDSTEIFEQIKSQFVKALTGSNEGVNVLMKCLWASSAKDRKKIVKELKDDLVALSCKEHTYQLMLTIFDIFDDTVYVQKAILDTLLLDDNIPELLKNIYGRKVLVYLCNRRDPKLFTEAGIAKILPGDANPNSKKTMDVRMSELQQVAVPRILKHFVANSSIWMEENCNILVLLSAVQAGSGDELSAALETLAKYVAVPPNSEQEGIDLRIAENAAIHMMLKKVAEHDKIRKENGLATFGEALISELTDEHFLVWLKNNRCCFLFLTILKNGSEDTITKLRSKIKSLSASVWRKKSALPKGCQLIQQIL